MHPSPPTNLLPPTPAANGRRSGRKRTAIVVGLLSATLLVSGCSKAANSEDGVATLSNGATPGTAATASAGDDETKMRDFSKCMRENGVPSFPDPKVDASGRVQLGGFQDGSVDPQSTEFRTGMEACQQYMQGVSIGPQNVDQTKLQDATLKYANCLREKGLTVKDLDMSQGPGGGGGAPGAGAPGAGGPGGAGQGGGPGGAGQGGGPGQGGGGGDFLARAYGLDPDDPAVKAATEACQPVLQQAMADSGIQVPGQ